MAIFCETLAETGIVAEACDVARMGLSGAYAARRRNPVFAAAWDAALTIARERLADTLLARSIEGNVEQIWRNGEIVGERHVIDNKLGLAILRRLDRLADTGLSVSTRGERTPAAPAPRPRPVDWDRMVAALHSDNPDDVAEALGLLQEPALSLAKGHKVEEVEGPPNSLIEHDEDRFLDLTDRCWFDHDDECWMTDFPPPAGFAGYESRAYDDVHDDDPYVRACTMEEAAILDSDAAADRAAERTQEEDLRDRWFALLGSADCDAIDGSLEPGP